MNVVRKIRNVVRGMVQRYGPPPLKRRLWNHEFAQGRWTCLETPPEASAHPSLEKYVNGGCVLDLGCGPGGTGYALQSGAYSHYTGVDISDVAIEKAIQRVQESDRAAKNDYIQADITTYVPTRPYDVILFGDSLYYIPYQRIAAMLQRYSTHLVASGVFMARMYDVRGKFRAILDIVESEFSVIEKHIDDSGVCVIVFAPRRAG